MRDSMLNVNGDVVEVDAGALVEMPVQERPGLGAWQLVFTGLMKGSASGWCWEKRKAGKMLRLPCTVAGWIDVANGLPEHGDRVQVVGAAAPSFVYYDHYLQGRKGGYWANQDDIVCWMPQPPLPRIKPDGGIA